MIQSFDNDLKDLREKHEQLRRRIEGMTQETTATGSVESVPRILPEEVKPEVSNATFEVLGTK